MMHPGFEPRHLDPPNLQLEYCLRRLVVQLRSFKPHEQQRVYWTKVSAILSHGRFDEGWKIVGVNHDERFSGIHQLRRRSPSGFPWPSGFFPSLSGRSRREDFASGWFGEPGPFRFFDGCSGRGGLFSLGVRGRFGVERSRSGWLGVPGLFGFDPKDDLVCLVRSPADDLVSPACWVAQEDD